MAAVTFEEAWALLGQQGTVHKIELGDTDSNRTLDYLGMDYLVRFDDNRALQVAWRELSWKRYYTYTFRDRGIERISEWKRLWLPWPRTMKPHVYVIQYYDDNGPLHIAAASADSIVAGLPQEAWSWHTNSGTRFYYRDVADVESVQWHREVSS